jgi:hypothetical protein
VVTSSQAKHQRNDESKSHYVPHNDPSLASGASNQRCLFCIDIRRIGSAFGRQPFFRA